MIEVRNRYLASYRRLISSRTPEIMIMKSGVYGINDNSEACDHSEIGTIESGEKSLGVVQYFTLPGLFHVESMEWGVDSMEWGMDSMEWGMDSILLPYGIQVE